MEGRRNIDTEYEADLLEEQKKLEYTIKTINSEILNYIEARKNITQYILDNRKKSIEEFEDDEDKVIEYFDHERFIKEEAYKAIDRRLKEFTILEFSPYFGRVDFAEENYGKDTIYIGRFGITPTGSEEALVVDWRAPVAALFYGSGLGGNTYVAPSGDISVEVLKKRQYIIKKKKLNGFFDSAVDIKDDILQLMLSKNSETKLTDIVMSIQEEQDKIIRQPRNKVVVVNGVAGSGKTTIALHRVAFLLYNYREILQDKVLILGPNPIFMEYISRVLPSLGETGVNQKTFTTFAIELLDLQRREVMNSKEYMERILNGDSEFIDQIVHKNSDSFIVELNNLIENTEREYYKLQDVVYNDTIIITKTECEKLFNEYYVNMPLFRRTNKIKRIIFSKLKDERDKVIRKIEQDYKNTIDKLNVEELELQQNSIDYARKLKIREAIAKLMEVKSSLTWLNNGQVKDIYSEIQSERLYTVEDLTALLYLSIKFEGLKVDVEIKHVVIDEAQDYSKLTFMVIKELTKCNGMTIVGDTNQRLIPIEGKIPFESIKEIIGDLEVENFKLNKSYRSTAEIMKYANKFLKENTVVPIVRQGSEVSEFTIAHKEELAKKINELLKAYNESEYESIAIICRDLKTTEKLGTLLKGDNYIKIINREDIIYNGGTVIIPSYLAKGLEFDGVIIVDDKDSEVDKYKYVMATRALHKLSVITIKK